MAAAEVTADSGAAGYKAAGVVFFTAEKGEVKNVLLALEERKVSSKQLGIETETGPDAKNRINTDVVVFPQGRRERKDEGDPVETAMREYHEETGNFGALTKHLLQFYEDDADDHGTAVKGKSFIVYFNNARMVVVFCEVPIDAYERTLRSLGKDDFKTAAPAVSQEQPSAGSEVPDGEEQPSKKRRKNASKHKSYRVGRENHLTPVWVTSDALREAVTSLDNNSSGHRGVSIDVTVCPRDSVDGTGRLGVSGATNTTEGAVTCRVPFYPMNLSIFRQREARIWLGLSVPTPDKEKSDTSGSGAPQA